MECSVTLAEIAEFRRLRTWIAAQIASALVRTWGEISPDTDILSEKAVKITDTLINRLADTDPWLKDERRIQAEIERERRELRGE